MTSTNIYTPIIPTYLYIKQHSVTGLKYYGKTTRDPYTYNGSGHHWLRHIKKHGKEHIVTLYVELFIDTRIVEVAVLFSKDNNIVESDAWANLKPENGLDGGTTKGTLPLSSRQKISDYAKTRTFSQETRQKISDAGKGRPASNKGKHHTQESKQKMSDAGKGRPKSEEHKAKISAANKGQIPYSKGKPMSEEQKKLISIANKGKPPVACPHCNKIGAGNSMKRWHFDNCKLLQSSST